MLSDKIKFSFEKNIDKFELYCKRNIFVCAPPTPVTTKPATKQSVARDSEASSIEALRKEYTSLLQSRNEKVTYC